MIDRIHIQALIDRSEQIPEPCLFIITPQGVIEGFPDTQTVTDQYFIIESAICNLNVGSKMTIENLAISYDHIIAVTLYSRLEDQQPSDRPF